MTNFLIENEEVRLVTLGPSGTTSSVIANKLKDVFEAEKNRKVVIDLFDTFELALSEISNNKADMILVPNAYHRITTFYWNTKLELVYSFVAGTQITVWQLLTRNVRRNAECTLLQRARQ